MTSSFFFTQKRLSLESSAQNSSCCIRLPAAVSFTNSVFSVTCLLALRTFGLDAAAAAHLLLMYLIADLIADLQCKSIVLSLVQLLLTIYTNFSRISSFRYRLAGLLAFMFSTSILLQILAWYTGDHLFQEPIKITESFL